MGGGVRVAGSETVSQTLAQGDGDVVFMSMDLWEIPNHFADGLG